MTASARLQALVRRFVALDAIGREGLVGRGDPSPISIVGDATRPAVLAFHGFAGTPKEVRVAADIAARLGVSAEVPRLSGHTANVADLMDVGWDDWVGDAKRAMDALARRSNGKVVVGGLSLGAVLATHLAATEPARVAGLFVLAHATWLDVASFRLPLGIFEKLNLLDNRFYIPKHSADIRDPAARRAHLTYAMNPIRSAIEVLRAGRVVRAELHRVKCPTLVVHGRLDRVCPVETAYRFAHELGTGNVTVRIMPGSGHIVTVDVDRREVALAIEDFLHRTTA
jgi:carboxylesterase